MIFLYGYYVYIFLLIDNNTNCWGKYKIKVRDQRDKNKK